MSSTMDYRDDPTRIERDNEEIRADMNATLDALGRKLSPGQLIDRSVNMLRDHGGEFAASLGEQVKRNPVPLVLTAVGLIWLIASQNRSQRTQAGSAYGYGTDDYRSAGYSTGNATVEGLDTGSDASGGKAAHLKERLQETAAHLKERVQQTTGAAREKLRASRETLRSSSDRARAGGGAAVNRVGSAARATREQAYRAKDSFTTMANEQPLALGAIGLVIGAIIGAALPTTRREDELLGSVRDRTLDRAREAGSEQYAHLRDKAVTAAERAQQAAKEAFTSSGENGGTGSPESTVERPPGASRDEGAFKGESRPVGRA